MKQKYDLFDDIGLLVQDWKEEIKRVQVAQENVMRRIAKEVPLQFDTFASAIEDVENYDAVLNYSKVLNITPKKSSFKIMANDEQATYAEYGYGIVGKRSPYQGGEIFGGDSVVGWQGYDLDSRYKHPELRYWHYKDKITWGQKSTPTYFNTYTWSVSNIPLMIKEEFTKAVAK